MSSDDAVRASEMLAMIESLERDPDTSGFVTSATVAHELERTRKVLTRIADAMELTAIINAQVSVPDHVGAKLDPWRDDILDRMARRYKQKLKRENARLKKKVESARLKHEQPCVEHNLALQASRTDSAADRPRDAVEGSETTEGTKGHDPSDSHRIGLDAEGNLHY